MFTSQAPIPTDSANDIFIRRARKLFVEAHTDNNAVADTTHVATFVRNLESVGFACSQELLDACKTLSLLELTKLNKEALAALQKLIGNHQQFSPMYPNFPSQVMSMSEAGLYLNAVLHYWTSGAFLPGAKKEPRPLFGEKTNLKVIQLGDKETFERMFKQMLASKTSISAIDKLDVSWFIKNYADDIYRLLPETIPHREIKAQVCQKLFQHTGLAETYIPKVCDTATDVLRIAVAMSSGDLSLAQAVKFRNFKGRETRVLLKTLNECKSPEYDMLRWKERWLRLGEKLHPGQYQNRFPVAANAFHILRNKQSIPQTFYGKLEFELSQKNVSGAIDLLKTRPGDFARRLDHLFRIADTVDDKESIVDQFSNVCTKVSSPVLLQLFQHFRNRKTAGSPIRVFFPKGEIAKAQAVPNELVPMDSGIADRIIELCKSELKNRFAKLPPLGRCYVDSELKNFLVPFSQRSASKSLRTASRGSRMSLPEADTLRFFIWWKNGTSRVDIDLSAAMFDKDFCFVSAVTYYNLRNFGGHHSGDIVDAPNGASEFIDVSKAKCQENKVRFIVMAISSFTNQPYCDLPECFAGWMSRIKPDSGEIYEPKSVEDKLDLTANSKIAIPLIFDLEKDTAIWADMSLLKWPYWYNTVAANLWGIQLTMKSMLEMKKANLYDLLSMHAEARGEIVDNANKAETIYSAESGIQFDLTRIASEYL